MSARRAAILLALLALAPAIAAQGAVLIPASGPVISMGDDGVGGIERGQHGFVPPPGGPVWNSQTTAGQLLGGSPPPDGEGDDEGLALAALPAAPSLQLLPGSSGGLELTGAPPDADVVLVLGLAAAPRRLPGGLLVPRPDLVLTGLHTDARGHLRLPLGGAGRPGGRLGLVLQAWVADPVGTAPAAPSNALVIETR